MAVNLEQTGLDSLPSAEPEERCYGAHAAHKDVGRDGHGKAVALAYDLLTFSPR